MKHRLWSLGVAALAVTATLIGVGVNASAAGTEGKPTARPPACAQPDPDGEPPAPAPTSLTTVGQAYYCIFDNYFSGPVLDSRTLLVPAFAAVTQEMQRRGVDQADATLPALTGRRDADWTAFSKVYKRVADALPDDATREAVAGAAIKAMVTALGDNHARWENESHPNLYGLGLSAIVGPGDVDPVATEPAYLNQIAPGGPAEQAGLELGDEVLAIDGVPLFTGGVFTVGVVNALLDKAAGATVEFTVHRPSTGQTFTANLITAPVRGQRPAVTSELVDGNIAYVTLPGFDVGLADQVLAAIASLRQRTALRGVILDLRGNGGGDPKAVARLLGALAHGKITSYECDVRDRCTPNRTDDSVELLNLPFVELTDRRCASACDSFSSTVKDLKLGRLVGTRTAGAVAGPAAGYLLNDGSGLLLPKYHEIAANKEFINRVGVAPDYYAPLTAADLSAGRDPGLAKAVSLL
ncbi:S41 family peptidase [Actinophytocola sp.]|uniref:S41 family peptidase n=1 Tax=Actinophytocola sp. TaxID=1872138 RepID=UPI00389A2400